MNPSRRQTWMVMTHVGRPEVPSRWGGMETIVNVFSGSIHLNSADRGALSLKEELEVEMRDYLIIR